MSEEKSSYTTVFVRYEYSRDDIFNKILHCREVRTAKGHMIKQKFILDDADLPEPLIGHLTIGEIISFEADIEFKNIEISYPHGKLKEKNGK